MPRRSRACGGPPDHRHAAGLPRGGEAPLDLRRVAPGRDRPGRAHPRVLRPDGGPHRSHFVGPPEPAQHPGAHRAGQAVPAGLRAGGGLDLPGGRLRPGRAALHCAPLGRPGSHRRADERLGRAPHSGRGRLRPCARGGQPHPARVLEDGLLRPGLRHGGLRAEPAPGRGRRGGGRHHGELLRRLPAREAVHGLRRGRRQGRRRSPAPCSAASGPCPTCSPPTTGCARRPSARP